MFPEKIHGFPKHYLGVFGNRKNFQGNPTFETSAVQKGKRGPEIGWAPAGVTAVHLIHMDVMDHVPVAIQ